MQQFSDPGSAGGIAMYWAPETQCSLVTWQTAYSALIEGDYSKCKGITPTCGLETETPTSAVTESSTTTSGTGTTEECISTEPLKVVCYYPNWPYYRNGKK